MFKTRGPIKWKKKMKNTIGQKYSLLVCERVFPNNFQNNQRMLLNDPKAFCCKIPWFVREPAVSALFLYIFDGIWR